MRKRLTGIFAGIVLCTLCLAQDAAPSQSNSTTPTGAQTTQSAASGQTTGVPRIAPGSVIPVELTRTVDVKKVRAGDAVEAKVTGDLKNGGLVVSKDTKVVGYVTQAQARTKEEKESLLGITFDHAVLKDGSVESLSSSIQAVIAPPSQDNADMGGGGAGPLPAGPGASGTSPGMTGGRPGGMGSGAPPQSPAAASGEQPASTPTRSDARRSITANTQGVVGIANLKLSTSGDGTQGSVFSSEKSNVKLESGTLMLLRVNQ